MPEREQILIVDDAPDTLEVMQRHLTAGGFRVIPVPGVTEAVRALESVQVDLVITDMRMPRIDGLELVRHIRQNYRDTEIIMVTGYASIPGAVEAMQTGVQEYLAKPFTEAELMAAVERTLARLRLRRPGTLPSSQRAPARWGLLGDSPAMQIIYKTLAKAAAVDATALITGESGTGKELVARAIHYQGPRRAAPFVPVNCGGIPDGLLESELFGYRKGAFTGANESRAGFFQAAEGGTLFLDEIAELGLPMQAVLLRALQDKTVYPLGSREPRTVDVRIIAATNKRLAKLTEAGRFREDLYYRINVIPIELPPLRERGDDVLILTRHFVGHFASEIGKPSLRFSDDALTALRAYPWPGNVRELENVVQRLVLLAEHDIIEAPDLPALMRFSATTPTPTVRRALAEVEREHIMQVLDTVSGNKTRAAQILGIDRKTLRAKLQSS